MENENPSYWSSVFIAAFIVGLIMSVIGLASQYMTIASEPSGASFTSGQLIGILACLIGAIGGFIGTRHYAKTNDVTFPIGKGALIGFLVGVVGVLISGAISWIWTTVIDPDLNQAAYDWAMSNVDAMSNLTEDQKDMQKGFIPDPNNPTSMLTQMGIGIVILGILNAISGLIGAKVFASEEE